MNASNHSIFKRVAVSEKKNIFASLAENAVQISVRGLESEEGYHVVGAQLDKYDFLMCHRTLDSKDKSTVEAVVLSFVFDDEKYFCQSQTTFDSGWVILDISGDLFQLQRRANVRFHLPEDYSAAFIISRQAGKPFFVDCDLIDVSAGGFRMKVPLTHPQLKVDDVVFGHLRLGNRRAIEVDVEVRYVQKSEDVSDKYIAVGVQFKTSDSIMENRLLNLMMNLQRELYLKYPNIK